MANDSSDPQVTDYWFNYRFTTGTVRVWVKTNANSDWELAQEVSPETAGFLQILLSGKQPVYYIAGVSLHSMTTIPSS